MPVTSASRSLSSKLLSPTFSVATAQVGEDNALPAAGGSYNFFPLSCTSFSWLNRVRAVASLLDDQVFPGRRVRVVIGASEVDEAEIRLSRGEDDLLPHADIVSVGTERRYSLGEGWVEAEKSGRTTGRVFNNHHCISV